MMFYCLFIKIHKNNAFYWFPTQSIFFFLDFMYNNTSANNHNSRQFSQIRLLYSLTLTIITNDN